MHVKKYALFQVACRLLSSYSMRSVVFVRVTKTTTHQSYKREYSTYSDSKLLDPVVGFAKLVCGLYQQN